LDTFLGDLLNLQGDQGLLRGEVRWLLDDQIRVNHFLIYNKRGLPFLRFCFFLLKFLFEGFDSRRGFRDIHWCLG